MFGRITWCKTEQTRLFFLFFFVKRKITKKRNIKINSRHSPPSCTLWIWLYILLYHLCGSPSSASCKKPNTNAIVRLCWMRNRFHQPSPSLTVKHPLPISKQAVFADRSSDWPIHSFFCVVRFQCFAVRLCIRYVNRLLEERKIEWEKWMRWERERKRENQTEKQKQRGNN